MSRLRPATPEDSWDVLRWRNDPAARAASTHTETVQPDEHAAWYARALADPRRHVLIVEEAEQAIGVARLDLDPVGDATVSINIAAEWRALGIGREAIEALTAYAATLGVRLLHAEVKASNKRALVAFRAAGYSVTGEREGLIVLTRDPHESAPLLDEDVRTDEFWGDPRRVSMTLTHLPTGTWVAGETGPDPGQERSKYRLRERLRAELTAIVAVRRARPTSRHEPIPDPGPERRR